MSRSFQCGEGSCVEEVPMSRRFQCQDGSDIKKVPMSRGFQCLAHSSVQKVPEGSNRKGNVRNVRSRSCKT